MKLSALLFLSIIIFNLTACGQSNNDEASNSVIIDTQIEALDGAKNVEDVLQQADQQQRDAIDSIK